MDKVKRNRVYVVEVWRGLVGTTKVTFHRDNRKPKEYYPSASSLQRLEYHMRGCQVALGVNHIHLHLYP